MKNFAPSLGAKQFGHGFTMLVNPRISLQAKHSQSDCSAFPYHALGEECGILPKQQRKQIVWWSVGSHRSKPVAQCWIGGLLRQKIATAIGNEHGRDLEFALIVAVLCVQQSHIGWKQEVGWLYNAEWLLFTSALSGLPVRHLDGTRGRSVIVKAALETPGLAMWENSIGWLSKHIRPLMQKFASCVKS